MQNLINMTKIYNGKSMPLYRKVFIYGRRNSLIIDNSKWIEKYKHYNMKQAKDGNLPQEKSKIDTQM